MSDYRNLTEAFGRPPFTYSPIRGKRQLEMPGGAHVALWVGLNIEYFDVDQPMRAAGGRDDPPPSPMGFGHYSYGMRVGVFRLLDMLSERGIRASVLLNSDVCRPYPEIMTAGNGAGWVWLGHGIRNRVGPKSLNSASEEREYLSRMTEAIIEGTGSRPLGWLGPGLSESPHTLELLADLGYIYVCDWVADDQPFALTANGASMINVPYGLDGLNDAGYLHRDISGRDYYNNIVDQFDVLYAEGMQAPRVMCLALHPHMSGQPFRAKNLARALDYICSRDGVWLATSDEIAEWYASSCQEAEASERLAHR